MSSFPFSFWKSSSGVSYDTDAQSYFNAIVSNSGTISTATKGYVNTFVLTAKAHNYWASLVRFNPMVGDQLAAALVPLKTGTGSTIDTNNNFVGGDYTEAGGLVGDGSTKYLNTGLVVSTGLTANSTHIAIYKKNNVMSDFPWGASDSVNHIRAYMPFSDGVFYSDQYNNGTGRVSAAAGGNTGIFLASRTSVTDHAVYRNGTSLGSNATGGGLLPAYSIYIYSLNTTNVATNYNTFTLMGYSIGAGLTSGQVTDFCSDWNALNTSLGRNTY